MFGEKIQSVIRVVIQLLGILMVIPAVANVPIVANLLEALGWVDANFAELESNVNSLIGAALTIYGFFFDGKNGSVTTLFMSAKRFEDRYVGSKVSLDVRAAALR